MIHFFLTLEKKAIPNLSELIKKNYISDRHIYLKIEQEEFIIIGDLINPRKEKPLKEYITDTLKNFKISKIRSLKGHFYLFYKNSHNNELIVANSLFSIFPIYFYENQGKQYISSKVEYFVQKGNLNFDYNKKFLLENILFYYPLFNDSYLKGIKLLPANSYIKFNCDGLQIIKHTNIENFYTDKPISWKKSVNNISDLFIHETKKYFPETPFWLALTGGFDGRTLASIALAENKDFTTYSFGDQTSLDSIIAKQIAQKARLKYEHFNLNQNYIKNYSLKNGLEFINSAEGTASFSRAHYLFATKLIADKAKYIITGNFGSDVLRGMNARGVLTSPNLCNLFYQPNPQKGIDYLKTSPEANWIYSSEFKNEWEELEFDLKNSAIFNNSFSGLTKNQRFYIIIFEDVFRKYFGAEMLNQTNYIINRTPYLDFEFLKELLKTNLAGVNVDFMEKNPLKRYQGQILYPHIIKRTNPLFNEFITANNYRPKDLLKIKGFINIIKGYAERKIFKTYFPTDPFSVYRSFEYNKNKIKSLISNSDLFNQKVIHREVSSPSHSDSLFIALSQMYWFKRKV